MVEVEHLLHEISCKLHASGSDDMDDGIFALPQTCVTGAVMMENNEHMINSDDYSLSTGIAQNYGITTRLLR